MKQTVSGWDSVKVPLRDCMFQILGFFVGGARATTVSLNPVALCEPSQNGLFFDCPHRHRLITDRPARSKALPCGSKISKSPSMRIEPLLLTVTFVGIFFPQIFNEILNTLAPTDPLQSTTPESRRLNCESCENPLYAKNRRLPPIVFRFGSAPQSLAKNPVREPCAATRLAGSNVHANCKFGIRAARVHPV